jgi:hypothetical protein
LNPDVQNQIRYQGTVILQTYPLLESLSLMVLSN